MPKPKQTANLIMDTKKREDGRKSHEKIKEKKDRQTGQAVK